MSWFRQRLRGFLEPAEDTGDPAVLARVEAKIDALLIAGAEDARAITFEAVKKVLANDRAAASAWVRWAEEKRLLLRGTDMECDDCGAKSWRAVGEMAPPVLCPGCGITLRRPFPPDRLTFRYRASEMLLQTVEADALSHCLTLRWFADLFGAGFGPSPLLGGYPGVNFYSENGKTLLGEADIVLVFRDGSLVLGECKRSGAGLDQRELDKLDALASVAKAEWVFVSTIDPSSACPAIWAACERPLPQIPPRFALSGDRLFDPRPVWPAGDNPLAWAPGPTMTQPGQRLTRFVAGLPRSVNWLLGDADPEGRLLRETD